MRNYDRKVTTHYFLMVNELFQLAFQMQPFFVVAILLARAEILV